MTKCDKCLTGLGDWSVPELLKQKLGFSELNSKHDSTTNVLKITKNRWIQRDRSGGRTNFPARSTYFSPLWSPFCPYTSSGFIPADRCHSSRLSAIPPLPLYLSAPFTGTDQRVTWQNAALSSTKARGRCERAMTSLTVKWSKAALSFFKFSNVLSFNINYLQNQILRPKITCNLFKYRLKVSIPCSL